jgi:hypothetical protein
MIKTENQEEGDYTTGINGINNYTSFEMLKLIK